MEWVPQVSHVVEFGNSRTMWDRSCKLEMIPSNKTKLKTIHYKVFDDGTLCGIQLHFANGIETEFYETDRATRKHIYTEEIDTCNDIH